MSRNLVHVLLGSALLGACGGEYRVDPGEKIPPAAPPGDEDDDVGSPPDWQNCYEGWRGMYYNLTIHDDYVNPRPEEELAPTDPAELDWWTNPRFEKYDPTLDFGQNWWPVDEGLEEDPKFFAVYWHAWIRVWDSGGANLSFTLGSADDSWVYVNGTPIAERPGIQDFVREPYEIYLESGQYPIEVWFAHRASEASGFSFRVIRDPGEDPERPAISICYPDFEAGG